MKFLTRLERSLGRFAVPNITLYIVALQSLAFALTKAAESRSVEHALEFLSKLKLVGQLALHGEPWRFITFAIIPPTENPIFFVFAMYMLYLMGTALENHWGTFQYNVFLIVGWMATIVVAVALPMGYANNVYLMESIFLAFAYLYPEFEILIFFIFPVKVKWLALLTWIAYFYQFATGNLLDKFLLLAAIANFLLFFHRQLWQSAKTGRRRIQTRAKSIQADDEPFHRCTSCGVTDKSDRKMEFRYCPQCVGTPCYCIHHINAHEHRTAILQSS